MLQLTTMTAASALRSGAGYACARGPSVGLWRMPSSFGVANPQQSFAVISHVKSRAHRVQ